MASKHHVSILGTWLPEALAALALAMLFLLTAAAAT